MADREPPPAPKPAPNSGNDRLPPLDGTKTQVDGAKDEGAGKKSVPVEDVTTANDK